MWVRPVNEVQTRIYFWEIIALGEDILFGEHKVGGVGSPLPLGQAPLRCAVLTVCRHLRG